MDENTEFRPTSSWKAITLGILASIVAAAVIGALVAILTATILIGVGTGAIVALFCAIWMWRSHRTGGDLGTHDADDRPEDADAQTLTRQWLVRGGGGTGI